MADSLRKYLLSDLGTRIQTVELRDAWQTGIAHQALPPAVRVLLGELAAAAALLAANLKFEGSVILQLQGDGPVALMVAECTAQLQLRGTASLREGIPVPANGTLNSLINPGGGGRFALMLDPGTQALNRQVYQGIVPLEGGSVAHALEHYMQQSEQLETRLWLAADDQRAAGLLLQRLPGAGGHTTEADRDDGWTTASALADTLKQDELLAVDGNELVHRLFHQLTLTAYPAQPVQWHCPCSRTRVTDMLRMLGQDELRDMITSRPTIEVSCNFCGQPYHFDAVDIEGLLNDAISSGTDDSTLH